MTTQPLSPYVDDGLVHQLNVQTHQIRNVLQAHDVPAEVSRGRVVAGRVSYELQAQMGNSIEKLRHLRHDLMQALGIRDLAITRQEGQWQIQIERLIDPPVPLVRLLDGNPALKSGSLLLGLSGAGTPLTVGLSDNHAGHALICGGSGAGKTALLRAVACGLAFTHRQADLQLLVIDGQQTNASRITAQESLRPLAYLPHMLTDPVAGPEAGSDLLHFLADEMDHRLTHRVAQPTLVALVDHAVELLETGAPDLAEAMLRLLQHGAAAGIHLILATDQPGSEKLDAFFRANLPLRIVGKTHDAAESKIATGMDDSFAEYLLGAGDFIAVSGEGVTRFQAAYIGDYELHHRLTQLRATPRPRLLARAVDMRLQLPRPAAGPEVQTFTVHANGVLLESADEPIHAPASAPVAPASAPVAPALVIKTVGVERETEPEVDEPLPF